MYLQTTSIVGIYLTLPKCVNFFSLALFVLTSSITRFILTCIQFYSRILSIPDDKSAKAWNTDVTIQREDKDLIEKKKIIIIY